MAQIGKSPPFFTAGPHMLPKPEIWSQVTFPMWVHNILKALSTLRTHRGEQKFRLRSEPRTQQKL